MSGEDLPYDRPTSPQSSISQPIADSQSTDGGIVHSWCNSGSCCWHLYLSLRCDVQMYRSCAGVVTRGLHCEDDQLSVLSPCSADLGISQYGLCNLLPWPHLQFVQKFLSCANPQFHQLSGWLVSDDPADVEVRCGCPGLAWLHVVSGCDASQLDVQPNSLKQCWRWLMVEKNELSRFWQQLWWTFLQSAC